MNFRIHLPLEKKLGHSIKYKLALTKSIAKD